MRIQMVLAVMILVWNPFVYGADDQQALEYVDPHTGNITQFADGYTGQIISREAFIEQTRQIEAQFHSNVNKTLGEADRYLATATEGADKEITHNVISGLEQAKQDVSSQHAYVIKQIESLKPKQAYERPRVLVSGGNSSGV